TTAYWQAGDYSAAARAVRDWIREESGRPAPYRTAARIYEDMGALDLAAEAAQRAVDSGPADAGAWERLGRLRLRLYDRRAAREALERARELMPSVEGLLDLALAYQLAGDIGGEVTACEQAVALAEGGGDRDEDDADDLDAARGPAASLLPSAWSRLAHALARTDRASDAAEACERALALGDDPEVSDLLEHLRALEPRVLPAA
ncbi:MAG: hypothetical protein H0X56_09515, partial [Solirubrobacterales bacterium]|nr:hypothetical protein [Solirubrobacterales bacterium]